MSAVAVTGLALLAAIGLAALVLALRPRRVCAAARPDAAIRAALRRTGQALAADLDRQTTPEQRARILAEIRRRADDQPGGTLRDALGDPEYLNGPYGGDTW